MKERQYEHPELYELAFSWRDYAKSVDFLIEAATRAGCGTINSMVELGCGPGQYCREFARRGVTAYGVDLAPEMALYTQGLYDKEKLPGYVLEADMRAFELEKPVDFACCMMATFSLLTTNQDVLDNFATVARNLTEGGVYVLELPHPRDVFKQDSSTQNVWEMESEQGTLKIDWASDAVFDPIAEVSAGTVKLCLEKDERTVAEVSGHERFRGYGYGLLQALMKLSGQFEVAGMYGDLDVAIPFDNGKKSWRMVMVLRKL